MNGVVAASNTSPRSLFSIQIQITWSYAEGAAPLRPHGPTHSTGAVAGTVAESGVVAVGNTVVVAGFGAEFGATDCPLLLPHAVTRIAASTAIGVGFTSASFALGLLGTSRNLRCIRTSGDLSGGAAVEVVDDQAIADMRDGLDPWSCWTGSEHTA